MTKQGNNTLYTTNRCTFVPTLLCRIHRPKPMAHYHCKRFAKSVEYKATLFLTYSLPTDTIIEVRHGAPPLNHTKSKAMHTPPAFQRSRRLSRLQPWYSFGVDVAASTTWEKFSRQKNNNQTTIGSTQVSSTSPKLHALILCLQKLELLYGLILHIIHVSGKRMIAQGTDECS
jgi:hypothetical protein